MTRAITPSTKTAVVLFNLGGPDSLDAVQPFLFNLFNDPAIISLPWPFRGLLARLISKKRAPKASEIYTLLGGKSPIVENTEAQARALEASLSGHGQVKVFTCMRYWHPMAHAVAHDVADYKPDHIILLPLYPQFSTTTTGSSLKDWERAAAKAGLKNTPTSQVCCYPTHPEFAKSYAQLIATYYAEAAKHGTPRILFSAHGLPEKIVKAGDPYQWQVEQTTQAVLRELLSSRRKSGSQAINDGLSVLPEIPASAGMTAQEEPIDYINCYQSRVGPLKWIGPSTEDEIARAAKEGKPIVLVPIAFVSEHSETLVELDIEYKHLAESHGARHYFRVPTVSADAHFIAALADICLKQTTQSGLAPDTGTRICGREWGGCPCKK